MINFKSANVKKYFINALKSVGLRDLNSSSGSFRELSEAEISQLLDDPQTTTKGIYERVKLAVLEQLKNDATSVGYVKKATAFNRQTGKRLLSALIDSNKHKPLLTEENCNALLRDLTASGVKEDGTITGINRGIRLDCIVEEVVETLLHGVYDQKLTTGEKKEAFSIWGKIRFTEFKNWLDTNNYPREDGMYAKYHYEKVRDGVLAEFTVRLGSREKAKKVLNMRIKDMPNGDNALKYLSANDGLLKASISGCALRYYMEGIVTANEYYNLTYKDLNDNLTLGDVLAAAGDSKSQIIAFFQSRSQEQDKEPKKTETKKENKIGNVMGETGREYVKYKTDTTAVVSFDLEPAAKLGKKGPWRGLKQIYDKIMGTLGEVYKLVPGVGLVLEMKEREGTWTEEQDQQKQQDFDQDPSRADYQEMPQEQQEIDKEPWKTGYQEMPTEYRTNGALNLAGEFYNKTKARILADKVQIQVLPAYTAKSLFKSEFSGDKSKAKAIVEYYKNRIAVAEKILATKMPASNSPEFNDPKYFAKLEKQIIGKEENASNYKEIVEIIEREKGTTAEKYMCDAIGFFEKIKNSEYPDCVNARYKIATEFFNLDSKVNSGRISNQNLDDMTTRFFESKGFQQMYSALDNASVAAVDAFAETNKFVEKDLKNHVMKEECERLSELEKAEAKRLKAEKEAKKEADIVNQNRVQIMNDVIKERYEDAARTM